jgi:hypothetical protein
LCIESISKSISAENLFEIIVLAYEYDCEHLKNAVSAFLSANSEKGYFIKLNMSKEWNEFALENHELASEILSGIYSRANFKQ